MAFSRRSIRHLPACIAGLIALLPCCGPAWAQNAPTKASSPDDTSPTETPLPATTTLERLVNPTGLSETPPYGWHPDFIGPFRGIFDVSFGVKLWPTRFYFQNFIFGGAIDLAPGIRARANFRRHEGEVKAFQVDPDELYLEAFNQYRAPTYNAG